MVTCARLAPACIELLPMAPPINSNFIADFKKTTATTIRTTTSPTTTTTKTKIANITTTTTTTTSTALKPKLAFSIDALVGDKMAIITQPRPPPNCSQRLSSPISLSISSTESTQTPISNACEPECDVVGDSPTPTSERCRSCSPMHGQSKITAINQQNPHNLAICSPIRPLPLTMMTNTLPQTSTPTGIPHATTTTMPTSIAPPSLPPHAVQPHFLTAQFQMAAALAHQHQQHQQHQQQQQQHQQHLSALHLPAGHPLTLFPHMAPNPHSHMLAGPPFVRDSYPLYPWFLSRHGRIFPHRFPGSKLHISD